LTPGTSNRGFHSPELSGHLGTTCWWRTRRSSYMGIADGAQR